VKILLERWTFALVTCAVLVIIAVYFIDRPVAEFVSGLPWTRVLRQPSFGIPVLVVAAAVIIVACGCFVMSGRSLSPWAEAALLSALSLAAGVLTTELVLKPLFGRTPPTSLISHHVSQFFWLHGDTNSSFPSGHTSQIAAIAGVLWLFYPRWRVLYLIVSLGIMAALVLGNWHYIGDVIAGAFVGWSASLLVVTLWRARTV